MSPDWAFDEMLPEVWFTDAPSRDILALSFRGDRPSLTVDVIAGLREAASAQGLQIVVFAQVKRDVFAARQLAQRMGVVLLDWPGDRGHLAQELAVRRLMRHSAMVVSDRLHALIMGMTEGALPIGLVQREDVKLARHFEAAGIFDVTLDVRNSLDIAVFMQGVMARDGIIRLAARQARNDVRANDQLISRVLHDSVRL